MFRDIKLLAFLLVLNGNIFGAEPSKSLHAISKTLQEGDSYNLFIAWGHPYQEGVLLSKETTESLNKYRIVRTFNGSPLKIRPVSKALFKSYMDTALQIIEGVDRNSSTNPGPCHQKIILVLEKQRSSAYSASYCVESVSLYDTERLSAFYQSLPD